MPTRATLRRETTLRRLARHMHPSFYGGQPRILAIVPFAHDEEIAQRVREKKPHPPTRIAAEAHANFLGERTSGGRLAEVLPKQ